MINLQQHRAHGGRSLLDNSIRRLLFSNPMLSIDICSKIIDTLKEKTEEEKEMIRSSLQESIAVYREKAKDSEGESQYQEICEQAKEHIQEWESYYGKASLADILSLIDSTKIQLEDIGSGYLTPKSIFEMLNEFVVGQEAYSKILALVVYTHILRTKEQEVNMPKANLLVFGPSGVGKTYGIQVLSKKLGIPFGIVNCNSVVPEGIVGEKFKDKLTQLYVELGHLDHAILYFDEFDKYFKKNGSYDDRLLEELLLFLDDNNTITYPDSFRNDCKYKTIPARNITCIVGGMFESLREAAEKRLSLKTLGFKSGLHEQVSENNLYELVNKEDLKKVLNSDELFGRIGHFVRVNNLSAEVLAEILLQARESPLDYFRNYFAHHGIRLMITEDGANEIANAAYNQQVGVRGLKSILWHIMEDEMHHIDEGARIIRLDKKYVQKQLNKRNMSNI